MSQDEWSYSYEEVEAAMCIWEAALEERPPTDLRMGWLKGGEGAAASRDACIMLCKMLEISYQKARELGYDDCFDWEFVPSWLDYLVTKDDVTPSEVTQSLSDEAMLDVVLGWKQVVNGEKRRLNSDGGI